MPFLHADGWPQNSSWECPSSDMLQTKRDCSCAGFEDKVLGVFHCLSKVLRELKQTNANKNCTRMTAGASRTARGLAPVLSAMAEEPKKRQHAG